MNRPTTKAILLIASLGWWVSQPSMADSESVSQMIQQARSLAREGDHVGAARILEQARMIANGL